MLCMRHQLQAQALARRGPATTLASQLVTTRSSCMEAVSTSVQLVVCLRSTVTTAVRTATVVSVWCWCRSSVSGALFSRDCSCK